MTSRFQTKEAARLFLKQMLNRIGPAIAFLPVTRTSFGMSWPGIRTRARRSVSVAGGRLKAASIRRAFDPWRRSDAAV
ncbi:hypothetical protein DJ021_09890 [Phenylobacterium hankyongense]|uniref:Uncharacterized protein n=1 Tax=Phenylobacterium hankyongense TaxID=1813876 RepID=A0A328B2M9_9CAUL|nr:hypothetical protein DJ021_09890 [Phenylobacterium hankyongense]